MRRQDLYAQMQKDVKAKKPACPNCNYVNFNGRICLVCGYDVTSIDPDWD